MYIYLIVFDFFIYKDKIPFFRITKSILIKTLYYIIYSILADCNEPGPLPSNQLSDLLKHVFVFTDLLSDILTPLPSQGN